MLAKSTMHALSGLGKAHIAQYNYNNCGYCHVVCRLAMVGNKPSSKRKWFRKGKLKGRGAKGKTGDMQPHSRGKGGNKKSGHGKHKKHRHK
jgi:hypothetical protein